MAVKRIRVRKGKGAWSKEDIFEFLKIATIAVPAAMAGAGLYAYAIESRAELEAMWLRGEF